MQNSHKLYILVDKKLSTQQQAVQACHAGIEFATKYGDIWKHQSLVLLGVEGENELEFWKWKLRDYSHVGFYESYWDNRLTAVACHGCDDIVSNLPLL